MQHITVLEHGCDLSLIRRMAFPKQLLTAIEGNSDIQPGVKARAHLLTECGESFGGNCGHKNQDKVRKQRCADWLNCITRIGIVG